MVSIYICMSVHHHPEARSPRRGLLAEHDGEARDGEGEGPDTIGGAGAGCCVLLLLLLLLLL